MSTQPSPQASSTGKTLSIIGIVCAVAGILIPIAGIAGIVLGFVAQSKGDSPRGKYVGIAAIVTTIIGFALNLTLQFSLMG